MSHVSKRDRAKARPEKRGYGSVKIAKGIAFALRDAVGNDKPSASDKAKMQPKR